MNVVEFCSEASIQNQMNIWLEENRDKKIIDIKYCVDENSSSALIIYKEGDTNGK
ncbi:hypothetical protein [Clostridium paraputrificum]|uniref:hypothetical protein n=1 Tax=Clostridium paraputrificum TaxID=29363 RepID=UPI0015F2CF18|nr:hypothetical protein [Clostridium paraputrificum]